MPRPPRDSDQTLAEDLTRLVAAAGSVRKVALALGLHPTTLQRSLKEGAFGRVTNQNIRLNWDEAVIRLDLALKRPNGAKSPKDTLLLMRKLNRLLSGAIAELEVAIDAQ